VSSLSAWENFYIIIGSSAGALTGLTFVVATLMQSAVGRPLRGLSRTVAAYTTPTIVHFSAALLVCALLSAPWPTLAPATVLVGVCGLAGIAYVGVVVCRIRRVEIYQPVVADWVWRGLLPGAAYAALLAGALLLPGSATPALFAVGAAVVLLLFIGIHNAWDEVTFITVELPQRSDSQQHGQPDGRAGQ
jgi:hypothetical protein